MSHDRKNQESSINIGSGRTWLEPSVEPVNDLNEMTGALGLIKNEIPP